MLTFSKMHGIGNDYIYINCFQETVTDPEKLSIFMSNVPKKRISVCVYSMQTAPKP